MGKQTTIITEYRQAGGNGVGTI